MVAQSYPSDVTDAEWVIVAPLVPEPKTNGRRSSSARRALLNAMVSVTKTGCGWEWLPHDVPNGKTVSLSFRLWRLEGIWEAIHTALRDVIRRAAGRATQPRAAIIDSRSVKPTSVGGPHCGVDGGKKVNGRKRPIIVDTQGLVLAVKVHAASISDRDGAPLLLADVPEHYPRIRKLWTESGDNGRFRTWAALHSVNGDGEIVNHWWTGSKGVWGGPGMEPPTIPSSFQVLPKRWIVERTFAWLDQNRRLRKDDEQMPATSETFIYAAMTRLMVRRLARQQALKTA